MERATTLAKHSTKKERRNNSSYLMLDHATMRTDAWRSLTPQSKAVFLELCLQHTGRNNGQLFIATRDGAKNCNIGKDTVTASLKMLVDRNFIRLVTGDVKMKSAAEYEVTLFEHNGKPATRKFKDWKPIKEPAKPHKKNKSLSAIKDKLPLHKDSEENIPRFRVVGVRG